VNRKSVPRLAMKYAIGEVLFLRMRFGMTLRLRAFKPYTVSHCAPYVMQTPAEAAHSRAKR
jgi:hypothetical protein